MAKVIYREKGPNLQIEGLPYEETFNFVEPVVFDDVPTEADIVELLANADDSTLVNPWSVDVLRGMKDYIPTTFRRVTRDMPKGLSEELFGVDDQWLPEADRVLLQLQTEIEAKAATIDAASIYGRRELGTVVNKAHIANRLHMIGQLYGHLPEREYPMLFGDLTDESTWDDALVEMKLLFIEYMKEVPLPGRNYEVVDKKPSSDLTESELRRRFPYVGWMEEILGDNFKGCLLYGSAARDDISKCSDYDNWALVDDVVEALRIFRGLNPCVVGDQVVTGPHSHDIPGAKHLGIHLIQNHPDYLHRHIRFLHDAREFALHTKVLAGSFPFPVVEQGEIIERGLSQAYIKLKTIAGSLNWAYSSPEKIQGKPALFEFIVKNLRFFMQHSLNALEEPNFRGKDELNRRLAERGLYIPEYKDDLGHISSSLIYAMRGVLTLQSELVKNHKPNLEFMVTDREYRPSDDVHEVMRLIAEDF